MRMCCIALSFFPFIQTLLIFKEIILLCISTNNRCSAHCSLVEIPRQMEAQANTTREQSNNNSIYDVGWQPSHGENGGVGNNKKRGYS